MNKSSAPFYCSHVAALAMTVIVIFVFFQANAYAGDVMETPTVAESTDAPGQATRWRYFDRNEVEGKIFYWRVRGEGQPVLELLSADPQRPVEVEDLTHDLPDGIVRLWSMTYWQPFTQMYRYGVGVVKNIFKEGDEYFAVDAEFMDIKLHHVDFSKPLPIPSPNPDRYSVAAMRESDKMYDALMRQWASISLEVSLQEYSVMIEPGLYESSIQPDFRYQDMPRLYIDQANQAFYISMRKGGGTALDRIWMKLDYPNRKWVHIEHLPVAVDLLEQVKLHHVRFPLSERDP